MVVTLSEGYTYITDGTYTAGSPGNITGGTTIKIATTNLGYTYQNELLKMPIPVAPKNTTGTPQNRLTNLRKITELISCDGYFVSESGGDSRDTLADNLSTLAKSTSLLKIIAKNNTQEKLFRGMVDKYELKYDIRLDKYELKITFGIGIVKGVA